VVTLVYDWNPLNDIAFAGPSRDASCGPMSRVSAGSQIITNDDAKERRP
jgi:hypothetical protein